MADLIFMFILSIPFIILGWYFLSKISFGVRRVLDESYESDGKVVERFVLQYLSPVGWQDTIDVYIPGDGWTYTCEYPYVFCSKQEAEEFCINNNVKYKESK